MTRAEWVGRCAARFADRGGLAAPLAEDHAAACLESLNSDLTESPEDSADDMSCWQA